MARLSYNQSGRVCACCSFPLSSHTTAWQTGQWVKKCFRRDQRASLDGKERHRRDMLVLSLVIVLIIYGMAQKLLERQSSKHRANHFPAARRRGWPSFVHQKTELKAIEQTLSSRIKPTPREVSLEGEIYELCTVASRKDSTCEQKSLRNRSLKVVTIQEDTQGNNNMVHWKKQELRMNEVRKKERKARRCMKLSKISTPQNYESPKAVLSFVVRGSMIYASCLLL